MSRGGIPNSFTVGRGDGAFNIASSSTDFIVDVNGFCSAEATDVNGAGLLYYSLGSPIRLHTRAGQSLATRRRSAHRRRHSHQPRVHVRRQKLAANTGDCR
ncbi:MAG: hypothetical protein WKH64_11480 [Chloroflexia bacterium]